MAVLQPENLSSPCFAARRASEKGVTLVCLHVGSVGCAVYL
jgi:hypothetical protein